MMLGFTSQSATSIRQVQHVMSTVKATDDKISQLRKDITTNRVPNAGMAMKYVQQLEQQNASRKAWLVQNRETIKALGVHASKVLTPPRDSFMTPDGPRAYGRKSDPFISINDMQAQAPVRLPAPQTPTISNPANIPPKVIPPGADLKRHQDQLMIRKRQEDKRRLELLRKKRDMERQQKLIEEGKLRQAKMVGKNRIKEEMRKASEQVNQGSNTATVVAKNAKESIKRAQQRALDNSKRRQAQVDVKPVAKTQPSAVVVRNAEKVQQEQKIRTGSNMTIYRGVEFSVKEPAQNFVTRLYRQLLGREPDRGGLNNWTRVLRTRRMTHKQVIDGFMNSGEYKRRQQKKTVPSQDQQRKAEANQLGEYVPEIAVKFMDEIQNESQKGNLPQEAMPEVVARWMQMDEEISNLHTRYLQGSIKQDLQEAMKAVDEIAGKAIQEMVAIIMKYQSAKPLPSRQTGVSGAPRNINIPIHRQMALNGMDKRSLAPIRTEQERGNQMGGNLGTLFPALRRSMQGVLKR